MLGLVRLLAFSTLATLTACASAPPPALPPPVEPIALGPGGSRSLAFLHSVERIPAGTLLGVARWESTGEVIDEIRAEGGSVRNKAYNVSIADLLRKYGYRVQDEADAVFDVGRAVRVRYQLAGILHGVEVDYVYKRRRRSRAAVQGRGNARVRFELQVHDLVRNETVFRRIYEGRGADVGSEPQPVVPAVVDAVRHALADPAFVAVVAPSEVSVAAGGFPKTRIPHCPTKPAALPDEMAEVLESVVVVHAGGVTGGGVIVSEEGHVLTAAHVVGDSDEVFARMRSGPMVPTRVLARSAGRDIALLDLPGHGYRCAPTVAADALPIGSEIFTINVLIDQQRPTVSRGVVSGYQDLDGRRFIQTDASVNPGSSGGPLFDRAGKVGGIVTDKVVGFGLEGIGLGVPIDEADRTLGFAWD